MKKFIATTLATAMLLCPISSLAASEFSDVPDGEWYAAYVKDTVERGLFQGTGAGKFSPNGELSVAEAVVLATRVRAIALNEEVTPNVVNWYDGAVKYAVEKGIIKDGDFANYEAKATREQMAYIFAHALPTEYYMSINNIKIQDIADIQNSAYKMDIHMLYQVGILTGTGDGLNYNPTGAINRASTAAIINRLAVPTLRVPKNNVGALEPYENYAAIPRIDGIFSATQTQTKVNVTKPTAIDFLITSELDMIKYFEAMETTGGKVGQIQQYLYEISDSTMEQFNQLALYLARGGFAAHGDGWENKTLTNGELKYQTCSDKKGTAVTILVTGTKLELVLFTVK